MSIFDKIGDVFGGVFGKIAGVLPLLDDLVKLRTSEADVAKLQAVFGSIQELGQKIEAIGIVGSSALEAGSAGGDDITLSEGQAIFDQAKQLVQEADELVTAIAKLKAGD